jgi:hypothetical protein
MANLILRQHLSQSSSPLNLVLSGVVRDDETESIYADIYWRWDDDPTMKPQFLGTTAAGFALEIPFDLKGKDIRLFAVSKTADGIQDVRDVREAEQIVFSSPADAFSGNADVEASETLDPYDLVNVWDDSGVSKARKADATDNTKPCAAFVVEAADPGGSLGPGENVRLFFVGNIIKTTGRTPGAVQYLSEAAGGMTETPPSGSGKIVQQIGVAINDSEVIFEPKYPVELG